MGIPMIVFIYLWYQYPLSAPIINVSEEGSDAHEDEIGAFVELLALS